jgi:hypothetical protein
MRLWVVLNSTARLSHSQEGLEILMPTRQWIRWQVITPLVIVLAMMLFVVFWSSEPELPQNLGDLNLTKALEGEEAAKVIDHLHGKGVSPHSNRIGIYGGKAGNAMLYLSSYTTEIESRKALEQMKSGIAGGHPVFGHYLEREISGRLVSFCLGLGQVHYFFGHENRIYWLAVDGGMAQGAIIDLLRQLGIGS